MTDHPERRDALVSRIVEQILHNNARGRRLVAVEGTDAAAAAAFADDAAQALRERGQHVTRMSLGSVDEATLRSDTVEPFRAGDLANGDDVILLVDGERLLNAAVIGVWHYTVWTFSDGTLPHGKANFIVDATDPAFPQEHYYDLCKLPPSFGERA
ncbi:hypothetical protein [Paramicrobacterium agarici]|uniref:Uridine kinase n=1 Tax=Paramicrobacterium agarici TaxID=630514 RepID=A0A2A9DVH1_9MICO|nr:hypothetical protein [Microbacterium agarici]PFG30584.1 hypothetical protein ATJ78_1519 [Microbacterium agarici]TQO23602.1 hypothetical protein FB385_2459 [Microbacterium agarici]